MRILVLGGVRSGKSALAEEMARRLQQAEGLSVTYVATARRSDAEMEARIRTHRARRPADWSTLEAGGEDPDELPRMLEEITPESSIVLLDCLSLWVATAVTAGGREAVFRGRVTRLLTALRRGPRHAVVVSLEAGMSLLPLEPLGREFLDRLGDANQAFAQAADHVAFAVAGIALPIKGGELP